MSFGDVVVLNAFDDTVARFMNASIAKSIVLLNCLCVCRVRNGKAPNISKREHSTSTPTNDRSKVTETKKYYDIFFFFLRLVFVVRVRFALVGGYR